MKSQQKHIENALYSRLSSHILCFACIYFVLINFFLNYLFKIRANINVSSNYLKAKVKFHLLSA